MLQASMFRLISSVHLEPLIRKNSTIMVCVLHRQIALTIRYFHLRGKTINKLNTGSVLSMEVKRVCLSCLVSEKTEEIEPRPK